MRRVATAVLISGHGSNLQAILDAAQSADYPAEIKLVMSNKADAFGLTRAQQAGVATLVVSHRDFADRETFDRAMDAALKAAGIELVVMAGFMRVLSDWFVRAWQGKLINIHPSLLPAYKGLDTHRRVLEAREKRHGATVHWVIAELDAGEVIVQEAIDVLPGETAETLAERVHAVEHRIYPQAVRQVAAQLRG